MSRQRFLEDHELEAFLGAVSASQHASRARDRALYSLLAFTGIRPTEALTLRRSDLSLSARLAYVRVVRLKKRRTRPEVTELEISGALAALLRLHCWRLGPDVRVFDLTRRQAHRRFQIYAERAGIKGHTLYDLRHTAATRFYLKTRDIEVVQHMLGHESPSTSSIYAHIPKSLLAWTAATLPSFT